MEMKFTHKCLYCKVMRQKQFRTQFCERKKDHLQCLNKNFTFSLIFSFLYLENLNNVQMVTLYNWELCRYYIDALYCICKAIVALFTWACRTTVPYPEHWATTAWPGARYEGTQYIDMLPGQVGQQSPILTLGYYSWAWGTIWGRTSPARCNSNTDDSRHARNPRPRDAVRPPKGTWCPVSGRIQWWETEGWVPACQLQKWISFYSKYEYRF